MASLRDRSGNFRPLQRLREIRVNWYVIAVAAVLLVGLYVFGVQRNDARLRQLLSDEAERQETVARMEQQNLALQRDIQNVGSMGYIEVHARSDHGYLKPGELRFKIENPDLLKGYTDEEWQYIMNEMVFDD